MPTDGPKYDFATVTSPGTEPKIHSIFDFTAESLEQLAFWLEQRGIHTPVSQIIGFKQQQDIRGRVAADGTITSGTGFTTSKIGTGQYLMTFNKALATVPAINATIDDNSSSLACKASNASTSVFQVNTYDMAGTATDSGFYFTASPFT